MAHFKNFAIDEMNRLEEVFNMWGDTFEKKENDGNFDPIPKGRYACVLENATIEETSGNKTPYLNLTTTISGGEFNNRKLWVKLWMTEGAYNMTSQQLDNLLVFKAIGAQDSQGAFMNKAADLVFQLVGKKIEVAVTGHDVYNDKTYEKTFVTGFLDTPNAAIQSAKDARVDGATTATSSATSTVSETEEIPF